MRDFRQHPQDTTLPPVPLTWDYAVRLRRKPPWDKDLALCTCSNGHTTRMVANIHSVGPDGTVMPSYVCPVEGCGYHEFVRLVGWDPNHVFEYCRDEP